MLTDKILRKVEVVAVTGMSPSTIDRQIRAGHFPASVKLSVRRVGWPASAVDAWMKQRTSRSLNVDHR